MSAQEQVATTVDAEIRRLAQEASNTHWRVGELLLRMRDEQLFKALNYRSCRQYLAHNDDTIGMRNAYQYMSIVETFGGVQHAAQFRDRGAEIRIRLEAADATKLCILARLIRKDDDPQSIFALFEQSLTLSREQLRAAVNAQLARRLLGGTTYQLPRQLDISEAGGSPVDTPASTSATILDQQAAVGATVHVDDSGESKECEAVQVPETPAAEGEEFQGEVVQPIRPAPLVQVSMFGDPPVRVSLTPFPLKEIGHLIATLRTELEYPRDVSQSIVQLRALEFELHRWGELLDRG